MSAPESIQKFYLFFNSKIFRHTSHYLLIWIDRKKLFTQLNSRRCYQFEPTKPFNCDTLLPNVFVFDNFCMLICLVDTAPLDEKLNHKIGTFCLNDSSLLYGKMCCSWQLRCWMRLCCHLSSATSGNYLGRLDYCDYPEEHRSSAHRGSRLCLQYGTA